MSQEPYWLSAFLDFPAEAYDAGVAYWADVTGYSVSAPRGDDDEFATLVAPYGDDYLRVQRVSDGPPRIHVDVHVDDPTQVPDGATVMADGGDFLTLRSPGGMVFCQVAHPGRVAPEARTWPDGRRSRPDQVCLDVPPSLYDAEFAFWERLTGWVPREPPSGSPFARLTPAEPQGLQLLVQRLDDEQDAVTAHLDWSTTDRDAEVAAHVAAGATQGGTFEGWTVMTDPVGMTYCITVRAPR